jgi:hypothetical protein
MTDGKNLEKINRKLKKATHLLLFRQHLRPGVREWELRKEIGKDYRDIIEILNAELEKIDLEVKTIGEGNDSIFLVTSKSPLMVKGGWRIDDIAVLAVSIAYITSNHGKASRKEVEALLREKFTAWKVEVNIDRWIKLGYLSEKDGMLYIDWRTRAEVDQKTLLNLILAD